MKLLIALTLAQLLLLACSFSETEAQKAGRFTRTEQSLEEAQRNATVECNDAAQCDAAWKLTKTYVEKSSKERLLRADDVAIDTDMPSGSGKPVYSATRTAKGSGATIVLYAQCRDMYGEERTVGSDYNGCAEKIIATQNGFVDYLKANLVAK
ncbi:hypothetical protein P9250_29105 [Caballeronia sp. LP006]|uniref:hypothetical protein n=1 Tax=Caballeronia sp. LP006 TaxID=3038552 RepID=UPI0028628E3F|nr:hypothetical protein [Caballeronia sp. LP006]MDR5831925.1 hypothetical protein [Caballeronia sp. LP006]